MWGRWGDHKRTDEPTDASKVNRRIKPNSTKKEAKCPKFNSRRSWRNNESSQKFKILESNKSFGKEARYQNSQSLIPCVKDKLKSLDNIFDKSSNSDKENDPSHSYIIPDVLEASPIIWNNE